jgi:hypothetical protein
MDTDEESETEAEVNGEAASTSSTSNRSEERNIPEAQKQTFLSGGASYENEKERQKTVECMACGGDVDRDDAMRVTFGGEDLYRHSGACPEGGE